LVSASHGSGGTLRDFLAAVIGEGGGPPTVKRGRGKIWGDKKDKRYFTSRGPVLDFDIRR